MKIKKLSRLVLGLELFLSHFIQGLSGNNFGLPQFSQQSLSFSSIFVFLYIFYKAVFTGATGASKGKTCSF